MDTSPLSSYPPQGRSSLRRAGGIGVALLCASGLAVACGAGGSAESAGAAVGVAPPPPLPISMPVVDFDAETELTDHDGSVIVGVGDGRLVARSGVDGVVFADLEVKGELRAVSADGQLAALWAPTAAGGSEITVVDLFDRHNDSVTHELDRLVEPEAFATDGSVLFVIDHEGAETPRTYRLASLDLATGEIAQMVGPDKLPLVEEMNGNGRRQVWSGDGTRLYTLYIRQAHHHHPTPGPEHDHPAAGTDGFVHVLDLAEEWAFCVDLPTEFGGGQLATTAMGLDSDGEEFVVADLTAGAVAFADTETLAVSEVAELPDLSWPLEPGADAMLHVALAGDQVALAADRAVRWIDRSGEEIPGTRSATAFAVDALAPRLLDQGRVIAISTSGQGSSAALPVPAVT